MAKITKKESTGHFDKNGKEIFVGNMVIARKSYGRYIKQSDSDIYIGYKCFCRTRVKKTQKGKFSVEHAPSYAKSSNSFNWGEMQVVDTNIINGVEFLYGEDMLLDEKTGLYFKCSESISFHEYLLIRLQ